MGKCLPYPARELPYQGMRAERYEWSLEFLIEHFKMGYLNETRMVTQKLADLRFDFRVPW